MNKELIKFIELCLADDVISDKEKKVIFRKAKELGVPKDECEIILEGLVLKNSKPVRKSAEKLNKKQEDKVDSRQPVKKDVEYKQKNPEKAKSRFCLSETKMPEVIRVILTLLLGFGYFLLTIIWCNVIVETGLPDDDIGVVFIVVFLAFVVPIIIAYFIFRFFKLQFEFFYFSFCAAVIIILGMNYDGGSITYSSSDYGIARDLTINHKGIIYFIIHNWWIILAVFVSYIFISFSSKESGKSVNKEIEKFEKKKSENSNKSPTLKMTEQAKKIVNKDIEKIEKRRGRKD